MLRVSRGRPYYYVRGSILSSSLPASLHKNLKARTGDRTLRGNLLSSDIRNHLGRKGSFRKYIHGIDFLLHYAKPHLAGQLFSLSLYFLRRSHESLRISCDTPASDQHTTISRPVFPLIRFPPV